MALHVAIFLGLLQGLTEFLPVSSSGHLMAAQRIFNMPEDMLMFNIVLHLATLCAVLIVFRKKVAELIRQPFCKTNICLLIATAITCAFVLVFKDFIDSTITYKILPITFFVTAILLFATTLFANSSRGISYKTGIFSGIAQGIAVIPGFSRSGFTISAALASGTRREEAAEFSFLMSVPIIVASFLYELASNSAPIAVEILPLSLAFITALISGIVAITLMLSIVKRVKLAWFSAYLVVLSIVLLFVF